MDQHGGFCNEGSFDEQYQQRAHNTLGNSHRQQHGECCECTSGQWCQPGQHPLLQALEESSRAEDKPTKQGRFNIAMMCPMSGQQLLLGPTRTKDCHAMIDGLHKAPAQLDLQEVILLAMYLWNNSWFCAFVFKSMLCSKGLGFSFSVPYLMA